MSARARSFIPALKMGAKIMPNDIAGLIGLPYVGDIYYIDPTNGSDSAGGKDQSDAFKTLAAGYAALTDSHHDVLVIVPGAVGSGSGTVETAAITWSKNLCHLIGNVGPVPMNSRARVTCITAGCSPFLTISGSGNSFHNVMFYSEATTNYINVRVSGSRNFFEFVHFAGPANATAGTNATAAALQLYGGQENLFSNCAIGMDTVTRTSTNCALQFSLGTQTNDRNVFENCLFPAYAGAATNFFVTVDASSLDRFNLFRGCVFMNGSSSGATTMTNAFSMPATPAGLLIFQDCLKVGATGWAATKTDLYMIGASSNGTFNLGIGYAVNPA